MFSPSSVCLYPSLLGLKDRSRSDYRFPSRSREFPNFLPRSSSSTKCAVHGPITCRRHCSQLAFRVLRGRAGGRSVEYTLKIRRKILLMGRLGPAQQLSRRASYSPLSFSPQKFSKLLVRLGYWFIIIDPERQSDCTKKKSSPLNCTATILEPYMPML